MLQPESTVAVFLHNGEEVGRRLCSDPTFSAYTNILALAYPVLSVRYEYDDTASLLSSLSGPVRF